MEPINFSEIKREDFILDHKGNLYLVLMSNQEFEEMFTLSSYILGYNIAKDNVSKLENDGCYTLIHRRNEYYVGRFRKLWEDIMP